MPFLRTRYDVRTGNSPNNPRRQINEITPWIDGGLTYGTSKTWADTLRAFRCGKLASSHNGQFPVENSIRLPMANPPPPRFHRLRPVSRFFRLGNPRGNENTFLLTMGTLWFRFHNAVAQRMCQRFGTANAGSNNSSSLNLWNEERIFNEARKLVIAVHQARQQDTGQEKEHQEDECAENQKVDEKRHQVPQRRRRRLCSMRISESLLACRGLAATVTAVALMDFIMTHGFKAAAATVDQVASWSSKAIVAARTSVRAPQVMAAPDA
ncbi:hypothetical protein HPB52_016680 [Rhipicephalus sanguineus]|uniref:Dual oxidase n=1 Tax=Rhipicephalus sanguineus TaxID=34632 RepID=A0A9D4T0V9_RHISA|nr:hypothetical protein HPB52_016680 [Rhipicephalus sanguineus]